MVCGPIRRKYGVNPFHRAKTPSFLINFTKQSKAPEYSPPLHVIPKECDPLHHLQARLDDIDGERHKTAEQTGGEGRSDVQSQSIRLEEMPLLIVQLLRLRVPSQLRRVQHHGAHHRRRGSLPQRLHALLLADAVDGLDAVRVATALLGRQTVVGGGADEGDLGGVAHDGTARATDHTAAHLLEEVHVLAVLSLAAPVQAAVVDAETRGRVGDLAEHSGRVASHHAVSRVSHPLYSLKKPSAFVILIIASKLFLYCLVAEPSPLHDYGFFPSSHLSCIRVLIKSRGCTQVVARMPAVPPRTKLAYGLKRRSASYPLRERLGINHVERQRITVEQKEITMPPLLSSLLFLALVALLALLALLRLLALNGEKEKREKSLKGGSNSRPFAY